MLTLAEVKDKIMKISIATQDLVGSFLTHLVSQRILPLEEMLDSEAQRRRGSSKRGDCETTPSSSTTNPFAIPERDKNTRIVLNSLNLFVTSETLFAIETK